MKIRHKGLQPLYAVIVIISISLISSKCNSDDDDMIPTDDDSNGEVVIDVGGIVARDDQNVVIDSSTMDLTDWQFDDVWTADESSLFSSSASGCTPHDSIFLDCYPNPSSDGEFNLESSRDVSYSFVIVDPTLKVIGTKDLDTNTSLALNLPSFSGDTLRIYYLATEDNCDYAGHGDIVIE